MRYLEQVCFDPSNTRNSQIPDYELIEDYELDD